VPEEIIALLSDHERLILSIVVDALMKHGIDHCPNCILIALGKPANFIGQRSSLCSDPAQPLRLDQPDDVTYVDIRRFSDLHKSTA
jgi:hypothetical protein